MSEERLGVPLPNDGSVTAVRSPPDGEEPRAVFVYARGGAGSNVNDAFGRHLCKRWVERGLTAVRLQFPNMEVGRLRPDSPGLLEGT